MVRNVDIAHYAPYGCGGGGGGTNNGHAFVLFLFFVLAVKAPAIAAIKNGNTLALVCC